MKHAVIMHWKKSQTVCGLSFNPFNVLKGQHFIQRYLDEMQTIDCEVCRQKVIDLRSKTREGGRCVLVDEIDGVITASPRNPKYLPDSDWVMEKRREYMNSPQYEAHRKLAAMRAEIEAELLNSLFKNSSKK